MGSSSLHLCCCDKIVCLKATWEEKSYFHLTLSANIPSPREVRTRAEGRNLNDHGVMMLTNLLNWLSHTKITSLWVAMPTEGWVLWQQLANIEDIPIDMPTGKSDRCNSSIETSFSNVTLGPENKNKIIGPQNICN